MISEKSTFSEVFLLQASLVHKNLSRSGASYRHCYFGGIKVLHHKFREITMSYTKSNDHSGLTSKGNLLIIFLTVII